MRTAALVLPLLLAACGASNPSTTPDDAGATDAPPGDTATPTDGGCRANELRIYSGECVGTTDNNCNGATCSGELFCYVARGFLPDGGPNPMVGCFCRSGSGGTGDDGGLVCDPPRDR